MTKFLAKSATITLTTAALFLFLFAAPAQAACTACFNSPPQVEPPVVYTPPPMPVAPLAYTAPVVPPTPVLTYPVVATSYAAPIYAPPIYAPIYTPIYTSAYCPQPAPAVSCDVCLTSASPVGPTALPGVYDLSGAGLNQPGVSYLVPTLGGMIETGNPQQVLQQTELSLAMR